jgi:hypothetical protein
MLRSGRCCVVIQAISYDPLTYKIDDVGPQDPHAATQHSPKRRACLAYTSRIRLHGNQVNHVERDREAELHKHNRANREPNQVGLCKDHRIC